MMKRRLSSSALLLLLHAAVVLAAFGPNVRIDHQDDPDCVLLWPAIAVGPGTGSVQSVYVVFEYDSMLIGSRADIMFQRSTDAGRTWLPADVIVGPGNPGATDPDIATDRKGNIYVVYLDSLSRNLCCVRSTDGGTTWSPATKINDAYSQVGTARIAVDSAGILFCAWNDRHLDGLHIWSSVSSDRGTTWSPSVRVCDDTSNLDCYQPDVFVQPGTNDYLVAADVPQPGWNLHAYLYRSTDGGQTFQPGVRLDAGGYAFAPRVVADAQHVICDYTGENVEARTFYTQPDTWGAPHLVGRSYPNGARLAISADGYVHSALMTGTGTYLTFYTFSSDHGVSWANPERVNDDTTAPAYDPDIAADSAGHVYTVWRDLKRGQIWFATNNPAAIAEQPTERAKGGTKAHAVTVRDGVRVEYQLPTSARVRATLHDAVGQRVGMLDAGEQKAGMHRLSWKSDQEGRELGAGAYFVLLHMGTEQARLKAVVR
jgi:hypothetical protein